MINISEGVAYLIIKNKKINYYVNIEQWIMQHSCAEDQVYFDILNLNVYSWSIKGLKYTYSKHQQMCVSNIQIDFNIIENRFLRIIRNEKGAKT